MWLSPCKLPDMPELWPLPGVQEEEVRNRASEAYNVTKLSLEARVRDLEGQVEQQHKVWGRRTGDWGRRRWRHSMLAGLDSSCQTCVSCLTDWTGLDVTRLSACLPSACLLLQSYQEGTGEQNDAYRSLAAADEQAAGAVDQRTDKLRGMQQALVQVRSLSRAPAQ